MSWTKEGIHHMEAQATGESPGGLGQPDSTQSRGRQGIKANQNRGLCRPD